MVEPLTLFQAISYIVKNLPEHDNLPRDLCIPKVLFKNEKSEKHLFIRTTQSNVFLPGVFRSLHK